MAVGNANKEGPMKKLLHLKEEHIKRSLSTTRRNTKVFLQFSICPFYDEVDSIQCGCACAPKQHLIRAKVDQEDKQILL